MWRNPNLVAASLLGAAIVLAAIIVGRGLSSVAEGIRFHPAPVLSPHYTARFPDKLTLLNDGNPPLHVSVRLETLNPIKVKLEK